MIRHANIRNSPAGPVRAGLLVCAGLGLACATGCVSGFNERIAIGTRPTASFGGAHGPGMASPNWAPPAGSGGGPAMAPPADRNRLDRSRWRTMVVVAPIDGVVHTEHFRGIAIVGRRAAPERAGVFLRTGSEDPPGWARDAVETAQDLGRAGMDPLLAPWRLIHAGRGGWWTWSPTEIWKRTRQDRPRWSAVGGRRQEKSHE